MIDTANEPVAWLNRPYSCRRSRIEQVTGLQVVVPGQIGDQFGHIPDEVTEISGLPEFFIDGQLDVSGLDVPGLTPLSALGTTHRVIETLAKVPGPAF